MTKTRKGIRLSPWRYVNHQGPIDGAKAVVDFEMRVIFIDATLPAVDLLESLLRAGHETGLHDAYAKLGHREPRTDWAEIK